MLENYARTLKMIRSLRIKMADLDRLFMCAFGNYLTLVLITAHTVNNVDFSDEQSHENEVYESD